MTVFVLALIVVVLAGIFIHPFLRPVPASPITGERGLLLDLRKRRDQALRAIKDFEFERDAGLMSEAELASLRDAQRSEGARALRDLERVRAARVRHVRRDGVVVTAAARRRVEELVEKRKEVR
jgi:hypothetical protein